jgi:hypothetical protein
MALGIHTGATHLDVLDPARRIGMLSMPGHLYTIGATEVGPRSPAATSSMVTSSGLTLRGPWPVPRWSAWRVWRRCRG